MIRRAFLTTLASAIVAPACRLPVAGTPIQDHQRAPAFSLPDQAGNPVSLASLIARGPAVLVFYRGPW